MRIGVLRRHPESDDVPRWFLGQSGFAYHVANAWENPDSTISLVRPNPFAPRERERTAQPQSRVQRLVRLRPLRAAGPVGCQWRGCRAAGVFRASTRHAR